MRILTACLALLYVVACTPEEPTAPPVAVGTNAQVLVLNEGLFRRGNASVSAYNPATSGVTQRAFPAQNAAELDVLQSASYANPARLLLVSNNTDELVLISREGLDELGRTSALGSPRYCHYLGNDEVIVTDLYADAVARINLTDGVRIQSRFPGEGAAIAVARGGLWVAAPEAKSLYLIDSVTLQLIDSIAIGFPATALKAVGDGGILYAAAGARGTDPTGALLRIDIAPKTVTLSKSFDDGQASLYPRLALAGDTVYCLQVGLDRVLSSTSEAPVIEAVSLPPGSVYYGLGVDPASGDVYLGDANNFIGAGKVIRLSAHSEIIDEFEAGSLPSGFVF